MATLTERTTAVTALLDSYAAALGADPALGPGMFAAAIATHLNFLFVRLADVVLATSLASGPHPADPTCAGPSTCPATPR